MTLKCLIMTFTGFTIVCIPMQIYIWYCLTAIPCIIFYLCQVQKSACPQFRFIYLVISVGPGLIKVILLPGNVVFKFHADIVILFVCFLNCWTCEYWKHWRLQKWEYCIGEHLFAFWLVFIFHEHIKDVWFCEAKFQ